MYAHEYICFLQNMNIMYLLVSWFFTRFFAGSGPVHILGFAGSMTGLVPITLVLTRFHTLTLAFGLVSGMNCIS